MWRKPFVLTGFLASTFLLTMSSSAIAQSPKRTDTIENPPQLIRVVLNNDQNGPVSGRLLVFAIPKADAEKQSHGKKVTYVGINPFQPNQVAVAAQEVEHLEPGHGITLDADVQAFPRGFSRLRPGSYELQAVLDVHHNYNYSDRVPGDMVSEVATAMLGGSNTTPTLTLSRTLKDSPIWNISDRLQSKPDTAAALTLAHKRTDDVSFVSPSLSHFWGRPISMRAFVVKPPDYNAHPQRRYPTVYWTHGFGAPTLHYMAYNAAKIYGLMKSGKMPPMIWVLLDQATAAGTTEFANSVNNGPWGTALTHELIPHLERSYRMDAAAGGRLLIGHSSGGWAVLWLQTHYPKIFGGVWSTAPDPIDFHDFIGTDLYAPNANVYRKPDGSARPLMRMQGKVIATFEQFAQLERVLGPVGGQMASFEWVFSPRGEDGRPEPMFDRDTGAVDAKVAAYWRDHYDIAHYLKKHWSQLKPDLSGKIHMYVGTEDTFYLDGPVHRLKAELDDLRAGAVIHFLPGKTHFEDLYTKNQDPDWLFKQMVWQMYHVARPQAGAGKG